MARDPMEVLAKLRGHATQEARRALGAETGALVAAEAEAARRAAAPAAEEEAGGDPLLLAAWMPRALRDRDLAVARAGRAAASMEGARRVLTQARREERAVEMVRQGRALDAARRAARKAQAAMDEHAQRRHAQDEH